MPILFAATIAALSASKTIAGSCVRGECAPETVLLQHIHRHGAMTQALNAAACTGVHSMANCAEVATSMGLSLGCDGSCNYVFAGDWDYEGCYVHKDFEGMAWYGTTPNGDDVADSVVLPDIPDSAGYRLDGTIDECVTTTTTTTIVTVTDASGNPVNTTTTTTTAQCLGRDFEACKEAAASLGLTEGGAGFPMDGDWGDKGCWAYKDGRGYDGMAWYGTVDGGDVPDDYDLADVSSDKYRLAATTEVCPTNVAGPAGSAGP